MKLTYIQRKSGVSSVLWAWGNGLALSHYPVKYVYKGHHLGNTVWVCKKDTICLAGDKTTRFSELIKEMQKEFLKDPGHVTRIKRIFDRKAKKVLQFINYLKNTDFSKVSNKELSQAYTGIVNAYISTYAYGEPIAFVSKDFADVILPYFKGKKGNMDDFHVLISPPEKSFLQREHHGMLNIALNAKPGHVKELIRKHARKFTWVPYDYGVTHYTEEHFENELSKILRKSKPELKKEYACLQSYTAQMRQKQKRLFRKYKIDSYHKKLFEIVQQSFYLIDYKKEVFTMLHWYSNKIFREIENRLGLKKQHVQYIMPEEMDNFILGRRKPDKKRLEERYEGFVIIVRSSGKVDVIEGKEALRISRQFYKEKRVSLKQLTGRVAQQGIAQGEARVLLDAKKCSEIRHGEILVTTMTSPDYMVAVKKAAAIVTDEGGVTCHAAIVSRELKIPCIVGTKNATKALKTGDLVEVDADNGVVRLL